MSNEVSAKAFIVLRFLSQIIGAGDVSGFSENELERVQDRFNRVRNFLSDSEKQTVVNVVKSAMLLTGKAIDVVRNPSLYDEKRNRTEWRSVDNHALGPILEMMLGVENFAKTGNWVTRADYQLAKEMLPIAAQASVKLQELAEFAAVLGRQADDPSVQAMARVSPDPIDGGGQLLYRGLNSVSMAGVIAATKLDSVWNISRGVSTSVDFSVAFDFASNRRGTVIEEGKASIIFTISNEDEAGLDMRYMSNFPNEEEVILSGNLRIDSWRYDCTLFKRSAEIDYKLFCDEMGNVVLTVEGIGDEVGKEFKVQLSLAEGQQVIQGLLTFMSEGVNPPYYKEAAEFLYGDGSTITDVEQFRREDIDILGVNATMRPIRNMKAKNLANRLSRLRRPKR